MLVILENNNFLLIIVQHDNIFNNYTSNFTLYTILLCVDSKYFVYLESFIKCIVA